jgi:hypothetical protein
MLNADYKLSDAAVTHHNILLKTSLVHPLRHRPSRPPSSPPSRSQLFATAPMGDPGSMKSISRLILKVRQHRLVPLLPDDLHLPEAQKVVVIPVVDAMGG